MSIKVYFLCLCLSKESAKQRNQNHKEWAAIKELDKSVSVRSRCTHTQGYLIYKVFVILLSLFHSSSFSHSEHFSELNCDTSKRRHFTI